MHKYLKRLMENFISSFLYGFYRVITILFFSLLNTTAKGFCTQKQIAFFATKFNQNLPIKLVLRGAENKRESP